MSVIDTTRKVLQDVIAPDLKAINVRLDAVERVMNLRFEQVDERFEQVGKRMNERFEQVDKHFEQMNKRMDERFAHMDERFAHSEKLTSAKFDQVLARVELLTGVVHANHQSEMKAMDLDRRMERIESNMAPKVEPGLSKS